MSSKNRSAVSAAAEHYRAGRLTEAESLYRAVLDKHPDDVDAIHGLAVLCHQRGHPEEALALFRRAIGLDPNSRVADRQLGRLLEQRGDPVGTAICYRRAARLRPLDAAAHADLARTLAGQGRLRDRFRANVGELAQGRGSEPFRTLTPFLQNARSSSAPLDSVAFRRATSRDHEG